MQTILQAGEMENGFHTSIETGIPPLIMFRILPTCGPGKNRTYDQTNMRSIPKEEQNYCPYLNNMRENQILSKLGNRLHFSNISILLTTNQVRYLCQRRQP